MARHLCALGIVIAVLSIPVKLQPPMMAQQPACLHGPHETPDQLARRRLALTWVRQINTFQIHGLANAKTYQPLSAFPEIQTPAGFSTQLIINTMGYAVSIKDTLDPCLFAYFSDQEGVIYSAQPIQ